jgi:hypothetical protein
MTTNSHQCKTNLFYAFNFIHTSFIPSSSIVLSIWLRLAAWWYQVPQTTSLRGAYCSVTYYGRFLPLTKYVPTPQRWACVKTYAVDVTTYRISEADAHSPSWVKIAHHDHHHRILFGVGAAGEAHQARVLFQAACISLFSEAPTPRIPPTKPNTTIKLWRTRVRRVYSLPHNLQYAHKHRPVSIQMQSI